MRAYAIGDIHGCAGLLEQALSFIEKDIEINPVLRPLRIFIGDYIDRGPDAAKAVDLLLKCSESHECVFLKGNHEFYLLQFLRSPDVLSEWQSVGGTTTLMSYGVSLLALHDARSIQRALWAALPPNHLNFYQQLRLHFEIGDYSFVHAGIRPGIKMSQQREEDMLFIREQFLDNQTRFDKVIVHGHTPVANPEVRNNRINIDTGAYATGNLTCLIIELEQVRFEIIS